MASAMDQKVKVADIFSLLKPSKVKEPVDTTPAAAEPQQSVEIIEVDDYIEVVKPEPPAKPKSGVTARDILTGSKSAPIEVDDDDNKGAEPTRKRRQRKQKGSLIVKFKYKRYKDQIEELEKKIRQSSAHTVNAMSMLNMQQPSQPQHKPAQLADLISTKINRFHPVSKLKTLEEPSQALLAYPESHYEHRKFALPLKKASNSAESTPDYSDTFYQALPFKQATGFSYTTRPLTTDNLKEISLIKIPSSNRREKFSRLFKQINTIPATTELWCDYYKPHSSRQLIIDKATVRDMHTWLSNSFKILKKSTKRFEFRKTYRQEDEMDDFIVNDCYDDEGDQSTEDESYTPLMIISGPTGVGKTSIVYALMEEINGYVYEINASQNRGKKDILVNLKELSTTQLVHSHSEDDFQKGIILFDDADILFEQDKGFWPVLKHTLSISRRPVVLTVTDLNVVPQSVRECAAAESSLFEVDNDLSSIRNYLYLIGLTRGIMYDDSVLEHLVASNGSDLRKSINEIQFISACEHKDGVLEVKYEHNEPAQEQAASLSGHQLQGELLSYADVWEANARSVINHEPMVDELVDNQYLVDDEETIKPLPFEFSMSSELLARETSKGFSMSSELLARETSKGFSLVKETFAVSALELRAKDEAFYGSRLKDSKRLTRSAFGFAVPSFSEYGSGSTNSVFSITPNSQYFAEVQPFIREFARYDSNVDAYNTEVIFRNRDLKTVEELMHGGLLQKKKFDADSSQYLRDCLEISRLPVTS